MAVAVTDVQISYAALRVFYHCFSLSFSTLHTHRVTMCINMIRFRRWRLIIYLRTTHINCRYKHTHQIAPYIHRAVPFGSRKRNMWKCETVLCMRPAKCAVCVMYLTIRWLKKNCKSEQISWKNDRRKKQKETNTQSCSLLGCRLLFIHIYWV